MKNKHNEKSTACDKHKLCIKDTSQYRICIQCGIEHCRCVLDEPPIRDCKKCNRDICDCYRHIPFLSMYDLDMVVDINFSDRIFRGMENKLSVNVIDTFEELFSDFVYTHLKINHNNFVCADCWFEFEKDNKKILQSYVNNLNKELNGFIRFQKQSLNKLLKGNNAEFIKNSRNFERRRGK